MGTRRKVIKIFSLGSYRACWAICRVVSSTRLSLHHSSTHVAGHRHGRHGVGSEKLEPRLSAFTIPLKNQTSQNQSYLWLSPMVCFFCFWWFFFHPMLRFSMLPHLSSCLPPPEKKPTPIEEILCGLWGFMIFQGLLDGRKVQEHKGHKGQGRCGGDCSRFRFMNRWSCKGSTESLVALPLLHLLTFSPTLASHHLTR